MLQWVTVIDKTSDAKYDEEFEKSEILGFLANGRKDYGEKSFTLGSQEFIGFYRFLGDF